MPTAYGLWTSFSSRALDWLYPPGCVLCGADGPECPCAECRETMPVPALAFVATGGEPMDYIACAFRYADSAREAVRRLKYHRETVLASFMAQEVARVIAGATEPDELLVPVPIHWRRRAWRGFNQAELLVEGPHGREVATRSLLRIKATRPQVGLSRADRLRNLNGAFQAASEVAGRSVVLVDDVVTSGQTARVCAEALRAAGATRVGVVAFAANLESEHRHSEVWPD